MRRILILLCSMVLGVFPAWGQQSVFDFAATPLSGTFTGTISLPDGSQLSASGVQVAPSSTFTAPDTSSWIGSGLTVSRTSTITLPDQSTIGPTGLTMTAASLLKGPDTSSWNSSGLMMSPGKQFALANGTSAAPGLTFTSQATAGFYREATDDIRLVLSGAIPALRAYKSAADSGVLSVPLGASSGYVVIGGRLCTSTTSAPTTGTTIQILATCSIPASALSVDGMGLKVKAWGQTAANGNNKVLEIFFGATMCASLTSAVNNGAIVAETTIIRTGAATQECAGMAVSGTGGAYAMRAAPAESTTSTIALTVKGTTPTASGDLTFKGMTVELIN